MNQFTYTGTELELFSQAINWKKYIKHLLSEYIKGDVLEVGAGIGSNTRLFCSCQYSNWLCLEPDKKLFQILEYFISSLNMTNYCAWNGSISLLNKNQFFNSIVYIDVLEHINNDKEELIQASQHLKPNGKLIILSPAHQWLFTSFDAAIGHYRRYNKQTLQAIIPPNIEVIKIAYLDCVGLLASIGNKLIFKQSQPTLKQIKIWDKFMVTISRKLDPLFGYRFGKSILLIGKNKIR